MKKKKEKKEMEVTREGNMKEKITGVGYINHRIKIFPCVTEVVMVVVIPIVAVNDSGDSGGWCGGGEASNT